MSAEQMETHLLGKTQEKSCWGTMGASEGKWDSGVQGWLPIPESEVADPDPSLGLLAPIRDLGLEPGKSISL